MNGLRTAYNAAVTFSRTRYWRNNTTYFEKALEHAPDFYFAVFTLGAVYSQRGEYEKAIVMDQRAIELRPDQADPYNNLGNVYLRTGRFDRAMEFFQRAITIDPLNATPYYNAGVTMQARGDLEAALRYYRRFLVLAKNPSGDMLARVRAAEQQWKARGGRLVRPE